LIVKGNNNDAPALSGRDTIKGIEALAFRDITVRLDVITEKLDYDKDGKVDLVRIMGSSILENELKTSGSKEASIRHEMTGGNLADRMTGGSADDMFTGGAGNDTIKGGDGYDVVIFSGNRGDYTFDLPGKVNKLFTVKHNSGADGTDTISEVEELRFADQTVHIVQEVRKVEINNDDDAKIDLIIWTGTDNADTIDGSTRADVNHSMEGGKGADVLKGSSMSDTFMTGDGNDTVYGGDNNDLIGADVVEYKADHSAYTVKNMQSATVSLVGSVQEGNLYTISCANVKAEYTVTSGDTLKVVAEHLGDAINASQNNALAHIKATVSGEAITLVGENYLFGVTTSVAMSKDIDVELSGRFSDAAYNHYVTVAKDNDVDTLYNIEQLVFNNTIVDLQPEESVRIENNGKKVPVITGTDYADVLYSTTHNEIMDGGAGRDYLVFGDDSGTDKVRNFKAGTDGDVIALLLGKYDVDGINGTGIDTIQELMAVITEDGHDTLLELGGDNTIRLVGVASDMLTKANFDILTADSF